MRLVDFLILILQTHAETLKRLAAFFGEENFLEMLENAEESSRNSPDFNVQTTPFAMCESTQTAGGIQPVRNGAKSPYTELEGAVREMDLPAILEFHLWAYPFYRVFIESGLELGCFSAGSDESRPAWLKLIEDTAAQAQTWAQNLPIPPSVATAAESAAHAPWIRFRTSTLKKLGLRPIDTVKPGGGRIERVSE